MCLGLYAYETNMKQFLEIAHIHGVKRTAGEGEKDGQRLCEPSKLDMEILINFQNGYICSQPSSSSSSPNSDDLYFIMMVALDSFPHHVPKPL
jgi:hypothetical protein